MKARHQTTMVEQRFEIEGLRELILLIGPHLAMALVDERRSRQHGADLRNSSRSVIPRPGLVVGSEVPRRRRCSHALGGLSAPRGCVLASRLPSTQLPKRRKRVST